MISKNIDTYKSNLPSKFVVNQLNVMILLKLSSSMPDFIQLRSCMRSQWCWHKFTIQQGASLDKETVLKLITEFVTPHLLIPVMFKVEGEDFCFLARNCYGALDKLFRAFLVVKNPLGVRMNLEVVMNYAPLNKMQMSMQFNILTVLKKRYINDTKHLDLSNFYKDPDLYELIYCPLSNMRIMRYILGEIKVAFPRVVSIDFSNNDIYSYKHLEILGQFVHIKKLNLRYNKLKSIEELSVLHGLSINELLLDQNPLCEDYDESSYVEAVKKYFPHITILDRVHIGSPGFLSPKRNYISPEHVELVDQFITHYFNIYDYSNRRKLEGLYHTDAFFSLTATYLPGQTTSSTARLTEYTIESRNLLKSSDYTKNFKLLRHGSNAILSALCKLPKTEHDPYTFSVDTTSSEAGIMISVYGVFREPSLVKTPLIRSFHRIFLLVKVKSQEYQIVNECIHVKNATSDEVERAFKIERQAVNPNIYLTNHKNLNESEKESVINILAQLTEMNTMWSKKCLEETRWDIKEAIKSFTELYKLGKIPAEAFQ